MENVAASPIAGGSTDDPVSPIQTADTKRTPVTEKIDGVPYHNLVWVRATGGQDIATGPGGNIALTGWHPEVALQALGDWAKADGMDTRNAAPKLRNSIHGALNHHVADHTLGSWADKPVVIVAPLDRMVAANGPPSMFNTVDTFWAMGPGTALRVPDATVVRPDTAGQLAPSEIARRIDTSTVLYAATMNEEREDHILQRLTSHDRSNLALSINIRAGFEGSAEDATLSMPRAARRDHVSSAVDAEMVRLSKTLATHSAIAELGPVRQGNNHGWQGSDVQDGTARMATSLGSSTGRHLDSAEDKAVDLMQAGRASEVSGLPGIGLQTRNLAQALVADGRYGAFAQAKAVDGELAAAVTNLSGSELSRPARERLLSMVERSASGLPSAAIQALDRYGRPTGKTYSATSLSDGPSQVAPESGEAVRQNARLTTLMRTALANEADPITANRLAKAIDHLSSNSAALLAGTVEKHHASPARQASRTTPPPGNALTAALPGPKEPTQQPDIRVGHSQQVLRADTPIDAIFARLRSIHEAADNPLQPAPTSFKKRLAAFETVMKGSADQVATQTLEKSGAATPAISNQEASIRSPSPSPRP
jgi:hypothetical protein